jgi:hypothetical protein
MLDADEAMIQHTQAELFAALPFEIEAVAIRFNENQRTGADQTHKR